VITDAFMYFTVFAAGVAVIALLGSLVFWLRASRLTRVAATAETITDVYTEALPTRLARLRAELAEREAAMEHVLWQLDRADARIGATTTRLTAVRARSDAAGQKIVGAKANVDRAKQALRLVLRAMELRRAILG